MPKSSPDRYEAIPITIHWLTAIIILLALGSGIQADNALDAGTNPRTGRHKRRAAQ